MNPAEKIRETKKEIKVYKKMFPRHLIEESKENGFVNAVNLIKAEAKLSVYKEWSAREKEILKLIKKYKSKTAYTWDAFEEEIKGRKNE